MRDSDSGVVKMTDCVDGVDVMGGSSLPRRMEDLGLEEKLDRTLLNAGEHSYQVFSLVWPFLPLD